MYINKTYKYIRILLTGSLIYKLKGIDPDNDILTFGVREQPGSDVIQVENFGLNEANIYLHKLLDREVILILSNNF